MSLASDTRRQDNWLKNKAGTTPASTQIHPEFQKILDQDHYKILDSGCGNGRISSVLAQQGHKVVGIDINESEIEYAKSIHHNIRFLVADSTDLPFKDNSFDHVVTLGLFGGVDRLTRSKILAESYRVVRPGGYIYLGEFGRITDPLVTTSTGKGWTEVYISDLHTTGEFGSVIVHPEDEKKSFIAHHFSELDLVQLIQDYKFSEREMHRVFTVSRVSGQKRPSWNVWLRKPL